MGGLRYVTGFPDRPPVRPNLSIGDALAALHGVIGVLMALRHREADGGKGRSSMSPVRGGIQHDGRSAARIRSVQGVARTHREQPDRHRAFETPT